MLKMLQCGLVASVLLVSTHAQAMVISGAPWPRVESWLQSGWSEFRFNQLTEQLSSLNSSAFLVIEHGKIVYEYGPVNQPMLMGEMQTGLLNVLYGAALKPKERNIYRRLTQSVYDDMRLRKDNKIPDTRLSAFWSSTVPWDGDHDGEARWSFQAEDYGFLAQYYEFTSGSGPESDFLFYVAVPLEMQDLDMSTDALYFASPKLRDVRMDFRLSARDLARLGALYLRQGVWNDTAVVDPQWISQSWQPRAYGISSWSNKPSGDYGLGWWLSNQGVHYPGVQVPEGAVSLRDQQGQFLLLLPTLDLVIVHRVDRQLGGQVTDIDCGSLIMSVLLAKRFVS